MGIEETWKRRWERARRQRASLGTGRVLLPSLSVFDIRRTSGSDPQLV
ncbi:hypothetical protein ACFYOF_18630 [Streptomyces sp. NPDC007148]